MGCDVYTLDVPFWYMLPVSNPQLTVLTPHANIYPGFKKMVDLYVFVYTQYPTYC